MSGSVGAVDSDLARSPNLSGDRSQAKLHNHSGRRLGLRLSNLLWSPDDSNSLPRSDGGRRSSFHKFLHRVAILHSQPRLPDDGGLTPSVPVFLFPDDKVDIPDSEATGKPNMTNQS